ncbi:hypothetical protein WN50_33150 [Limnoraphis robusta CS-951]|uniref:Uncharacterized protein n=1 Tax=Limnoraphis robusta CS-951 TaxID=1637645 RepID=A0A0J9EX59_9CYAN|nr:hypothetical protein WN50_33150 [Limnoraphis robusta CS-951]
MLKQAVLTKPRLIPCIIEKSSPSIVNPNFDVQSRWSLTRLSDCGGISATRTVSGKLKPAKDAKSVYGIDANRVFKRLENPRRLPRSKDSPTEQSAPTWVESKLRRHLKTKADFGTLRL